MFDYEVLTARTVSFTDSDNRAIQGVQLWVICKTSDPNWGDCEVVKLWIPSTSPLYQMAKALRLHDKVKVAFNPKGRPIAIEKAA